MDAAKLFFEELSDFLLGDLCFERNPYNWYVVNKVIDGKQCTIIWHVDDLMISHVDPNVITSIIDRLTVKYGEMMPMLVNRGKINEYLWIVFDFSKNAEVKITMY